MEVPSDLARLTQLLQAADPQIVDDLGLLPHADLRPSGYMQAPRNALTFASTGGDGVHNSVLDLGEGISNASPIVMTVPMADQPNRVVGADLRQFLGLGLHSGYFILEQLQYDFAGTASELELRHWEQELSPAGLALLAVLKQELALAEWSDIAGQLAQLERDFSSRLVISD